MSRVILSRTSIRFAPRLAGFIFLLAGLPLASSRAQATEGGALEAGAAATDITTPPLTVPRDAGAQLFTVWRLRQQKVEDGDETRAAELLSRVDELRREQGIRRLDTHAAALILEADRKRLAGDHAAAATRLDSAERLAPGLPEIAYARGRSAISAQPFAVHQWIRFRIQGAVDGVTDPHRRTLILGDALLSLLLLLGVGCFVFLLSQLARYALPLYHDLVTAFPAVLRFVLIASGVLLVLIPFFFGFGPLLLLFPLLLLTFSYQNRGERFATWMIVIFLSATPWLLRIGDRLIEAGTGTVQAMHGLNNNPTDARALDVVSSAADTGDWVAQVIRGLAYKRMGQLKDALEDLDAAAQQGPPELAVGIVENNRGNVLLALGRVSEAERAYQRALERLPAHPEPLFNLHRAALARGDRPQADEWLQRATRIEPQRVADWSEDSERSINRFVVDVELPEGTLLRREVEGLFAATPFSTRLWVTLAGPLPDLSAPVFGLATLIGLIVLGRLKPRLRLTWPCGRCGRPAPATVTQVAEAKPNCEQCDSLFVRNLPVDRRVRFEKEEQVSRYQEFVRWSQRGGAVLFPGLGDLLRGRAIRGLLLVLFALYFALSIARPTGFLLDPLPTMGGGLFRVWTFAGLLALLWVASAARVFRETRETT